MEKLFMTVIGFLAVSNFAAAADKNNKSTCRREAIRNTEAVSAFMYEKEEGLDSKRTKVISTSSDQLRFEIETFAIQTDPLHCIYSIRMGKNVLGDCWMTQIEQTECSG